MKIEEVRMKHLITCCHNENPMTLRSRDAEMPLIDGWGSEGYIVAVDASNCSDEQKLQKMKTYIWGLNGYGVNFSFLFLRFCKEGEEFFYPAVAMYMKRDNGENIERFTTLEYYARRAMDFGSDEKHDFINDYTMLTFKKGENELVSACDQLAAQMNAQLEGFALAPSPTHNMERITRANRSECYVPFVKKEPK